MYCLARGCVLLVVWNMPFSVCVCVCVCVGGVCLVEGIGVALMGREVYSIGGRGSVASGCAISVVYVVQYLATG